MSKRPYLAQTASPAFGSVRGQTIATRAMETSDEQEPPETPRGAGLTQPWLASLAVPVTGDLSGMTILTKASPETTDEGDESE